MSFLHHMMGRGIKGATCTGTGRRAACNLLESILARRQMSAAQGDLLAARLAFEAEQRGELAVAAERYESVARMKFAPRWALERAAAVAAVQGDWRAATQLYRQLGEDGGVVTTLTQAEILLAAGNPASAAETFRAALCRLLDAEFSLPENIESYAVALSNDRLQNEESTARIETLLDQGTAFLKSGRYLRARETLEDALSLLDLLLAGQAGWVVAETRCAGANAAQVGTVLGETLVPLVQLADTLLRYLARTSLASSLADALRQRNLREDLALWATGANEVTALLNGERQRLAVLAAAHPNHAELHYRLGLLCRAAGDLPAAAAAFRQVVAIQPNYTRAVVRLAVTLRQIGKPDQLPVVLAAGFAVSVESLGQHYTLGLCTSDSKRFDRAVAAMSADVAGRDTRDVKANLAMTLADMGLLDEKRRAWKEPTVATAPTP